MYKPRGKKPATSTKEQQIDQTQQSLQLVIPMKLLAWEDASVWKKFFESSVDLRIGGDLVENVLCRKGVYQFTRHYIICDYSLTEAYSVPHSTPIERRKLKFH